MKKLTITPETQAPISVCNPCKPISQIKRFHAGDTLVVKTDDAGYEKGAILPVYGYSRTPEGLNVITDGPTPSNLRDKCLYPEGAVTEFLFRQLPRTIAEIPVLTAEEYLERIPAAKATNPVKVAKVIPMYPEHSAHTFAA